MNGDIIIVGNGENILKKENGSLIDSFETVVRLGQYQIKDYEKFVGTKTDIISTIWWKLNIERLRTTKVILSVPLNFQTENLRLDVLKDTKYQLHKKNIIYINELEDTSSIESMFYEKMPTAFINKNTLNFSLGFKTFYYIKKLFPTKKIYTTGFDFFKSGWYWDKAHNRNRGNNHPYLYEKLWYKKALKDKTLFSI